MCKTELRYLVAGAAFAHVDVPRQHMMMRGRIVSAKWDSGVAACISYCTRSTQNVRDQLGTSCGWSEFDQNLQMLMYHAVCDAERSIISCEMGWLRQGVHTILPAFYEEVLDVYCGDDVEAGPDWTTTEHAARKHRSTGG